MAMIDLRRGLSGVPCKLTPLFGNEWGLAFSDEQLLEVIDAIEKKWPLVVAGVDEFNTIERFALTVLVRQYVYQTGDTRALKAE